MWIIIPLTFCPCAPVSADSTSASEWRIQAINARVLDLLVPFKSRWLYHPNQNSSASIKAVLPAFTDLNYDDLEIGHGGEAMRQYGAFMSGNLHESLWPDLWDNLTEYCQQDTYAMVVLLDVLRQYAGDNYNG